ncbi:NUDIX hydrolase [Amorphus sp. 3PC139-8]|uniref:NUDIX hydrolase n=1 Tax=Amorphus sp. 3PC139-8 TaxID=2735676 RepID=UPI00345D59BF
MAADGDIVLRPVSSFAIGFRDVVPAFATIRRADIEARWNAAVAANPALFNGTVLLFQDVAVQGAALSAVAVPVDYATFSAFMAWGGPEPRLTNLFGAAAVVSRDGGLLLGRMGRRTDDPGTVKLVGGTPDLNDVIDGRVDMFGSIARELAEETGLRVDEAAREPKLWYASDPPYGALIQVLRFPQDGATLAARVRDFLHEDNDPELQDVVVLDARTDPSMLGLPPYSLAIARQLFAA